MNGSETCTEQNFLHIAIADEMLSLGQNVIKNIIMGEETWVYKYDMEAVSKH